MFLFTIHVYSRKKLFEFEKKYLIVQAHTLVVSRNCDGILVSPMREEEPRDTTVMVSLAIVIGASVVFIVLLLAVVSLAFYRWNLDTIQLELSTKFPKFHNIWRKPVLRLLLFHCS